MEQVWLDIADMFKVANESMTQMIKATSQMNETIKRNVANPLPRYITYEGDYYRIRSRQRNSMIPWRDIFNQ